MDQAALAAPGKNVVELKLAEIKPKASAEETASPTVQMSPGKALTPDWSAQPVKAAAGSHMPALIEQVRQVADYLATRTDGVIKSGPQGMEANLKLYPPDLGGVRVQLSVSSSGATQAQFVVERPETAQLLQQHLPAFQDSLSRHGLSVESLRVTVAPTSSAAESAWKQADSSDQRPADPWAQPRQEPQNQKRDAQAWDEAYEQQA